MKTSTVVLLLVGAAAAYLIWTGMSVASLQWIVQGVGVSVNGLTTTLNVTFIVQNPASTEVTINNMLVTATLNGNPIGTGLVSGVIPPGQSQISVGIVMSDINLINDLATLTTAGSGAQIVLSGKGLVNNLGGSFSTTYTV